jgi:hypothetical protein
MSARQRRGVRISAASTRGSAEVAGRVEVGDPAAAHDGEVEGHVLADSSRSQGA